MDRASPVHHARSRRTPRVDGKSAIHPATRLAARQSVGASSAREAFQPRNGIAGFPGLKSGLLVSSRTVGDSLSIRPGDTSSIGLATAHHGKGDPCQDVGWTALHRSTMRVTANATGGWKKHHPPDNPTGDTPVCGSELCSRGLSAQKWNSRLSRTEVRATRVQPDRRRFPVNLPWRRELDRACDCSSRQRRSLSGRRVDRASPVHHAGSRRTPRVDGKSTIPPTTRRATRRSVGASAAREAFKHRNGVAGFPGLKSGLRRK